MSMKHEIAKLELVIDELTKVNGGLRNELSAAKRELATKVQDYQSANSRCEGVRDQLKLIRFNLEMGCELIYPTMSLIAPEVPPGFPPPYDDLEPEQRLLRKAYSLANPYSPPEGYLDAMQAAGLSR